MIQDNKLISRSSIYEHISFYFCTGFLLKQLFFVVIRIFFVETVHGEPHANKNDFMIPLETISRCLSAQTRFDPCVTAQRVNDAWDKIPVKGIQKVYNRWI